MALNITLDGFVYDGDGNITSSNVAYQAYFYKVGAGSSPSKWNNKRVVENTGYWNINLGDGDWLTQDGNAASSDEVIIVFWSPHTADRMDSCAQLDEWSCFRIILDGSSTYSTNVQIKPNICPDLHWSLPSSSLVGSTVYIVNSSDDEHSWNFSGTTMHHTDNWRTTLMMVNSIDNSDYDWGDGNQNNNQSGTPDLGHTYLASGDYDVELVIEDECGCTVTGTDQIRILNRPPVPNIIMVPGDPDPNEPVSFQYTGTDLDDTITNIAWTIGDSGSYGNTNTEAPTSSRDDVIPHANGLGTDWYGEAAVSGAFTNPGSHTVSIVISWWDGFTTQTANYSENFNQSRFSGPAVNFTQDPTEAELDTTVRFSNVSTNIDRVGLGLPDHYEYTWRWTDSGDVETETDVPFTYELEKTPTTADCQVQLCAQWSDGWDTHNTCVEKDVVFDTIVTISEEDCYYNLNIIGTSEDGSVTGYGWTIYSGTGQSGPWTATWSSPTGLDQNDKKICFTSVGWYKVEGTVYGAGASTSDDEVLYVTTVCPAGDSIYNLWNGTGIQDVGADWQHSGSGMETAEAKHTGTYGLDATGLTKNDKINFTAPGVSNVPLSYYDFLRIWINIQDVPSGSVIDLEFKTVGSKSGDSLNLVNYIDTSRVGIWQKAMVPLDDFNFPDGGETYLNKLIFTAAGSMGFWLDDMSLTIGTVERDVIPICAPDVSGVEVPISKTVKAKELKPSIKGRMDIQPSTRVIHSSDVNTNRPFPGPKNI